MRDGGGNSFERVSYFLRVEFSDLTPDFIALSVEENKCWREFKIVNRRKFPANGFLNIYTNNMNWNADSVSTIKFFFKLVNGGLNFGASNSIWGLKFKKHGCASADHFLYLFCIVHERRLARMQNNPCREKASDNNAKGEVVVPFGVVCKQDKPCRDDEAQGDENKGILMQY
jgi:hypothetical protein